MNHEGPFIGATTDAVKKASDTGRYRQWLLKKVVKPTQSICVSSAATNSAAGQIATETVAMESGSGEGSASRKNLGNYGK